MPAPSETSILDEMKARYEQTVRNLLPDDIAAIESDKPLNAQQANCTKIAAARALWDDIQRTKALLESPGFGGGEN